MGRAVVKKPEGVSSNPARVNVFFVDSSSVRMKTNKKYSRSFKEWHILPTNQAYFESEQSHVFCCAFAKHDCIHA